MIRALYERLTGRPWLTVRSAAEEFGPPPGAVFAEALKHYTDQELYERGHVILRELRAHQAAVEALLAQAEAEAETEGVAR